MNRTVRDLIRSHQVPSGLIRYPIGTCEISRLLISCDLVKSHEIPYQNSSPADRSRRLPGGPQHHAAEAMTKPSWREHSDLLLPCYDESGRKSSEILRPILGLRGQQKYLHSA